MGLLSSGSNKDKVGLLSSLGVGDHLVTSHHSSVASLADCGVSEGCSIDTCAYSDLRGALGVPQDCPNIFPEKAGTSLHSVDT